MYLQISYKCKIRLYMTHENTHPYLATSVGVINSNAYSLSHLMETSTSSRR